MMFNSITYGKLTKDEMFNIIANKIVDKTRHYTLSIGCDSQVHNETKVAVSVLLHEVGKGGIFFINTSYTKKYRPSELAERMYFEASKSLQMAKDLTKYLKDLQLDYKLKIDLDLGNKGKTKQVIDGIVGWVTSEGYVAETKPFACAASVVADRYSK